MIRVGTKAFDMVTGFAGVVTARAEYLHDEPKVLLEAVDKTDRPIEWWFVERRVIELESCERVMKE